MRPRTLAVLPVVAVAVSLLSGCVFSPGANTARTVTADEIETLAADELEANVGIRPTIDCGDEDIPVKVGTSITCLLVDPGAALEFDVVISFTEVSGREYSIDIQVADVPNNAAPPTAAPGASVDISSIEALAVQALVKVLDYVPAVACEGDSVEIVVGATVDCSYESPEGRVDAVVTITEFDATTGTYRIRVD